MERAEVTEEMETVASHKRLPGGEEKVNEELKRPRDDDEEELEMLADLAEWRINWATWSSCYGSVEKRTEVLSVRFSMEMGPVSALQIFSVKVLELNMSCWPIDVFGFIAVRDSVDGNRNYIFERVRDNCQTLTAQDSSLVLTGPIRSVQLIDPIIFEIELRVKGTRSSEDNVLSAQVFEYNCITQFYRAGSLLKYMVSAPRSTLEFKYAHLCSALEARIEAWFSEGSTNFSMKFVARTASIDQDVKLMDSKGARVALCDDGFIDLSRNVVVVEGHSGELIVGAQVRQGGDEEAAKIYREKRIGRFGRENGQNPKQTCDTRVRLKGEPGKKRPQWHSFKKNRQKPHEATLPSSTRSGAPPNDASTTATASITESLVHVPGEEVRAEGTARPHRLNGERQAAENSPATLARRQGPKMSTLPEAPATPGKGSH
uniref:Uncharacterized protein n=1 Tax=Avena sativa TaxID=4498 RepID=A0ACD5UXJ4_AVESA